MTPSSQPPVTVARDLSRAQAEIIRGLLEAQGIPAMLSQEAAGSILPVDVGAFGQVDVLVAGELAPRAREILDQMADQSSPDDEG